MNDLIIPISPKVKKTSFKGSPYYNYSVLNYLKKKYPEACVIIPNVKNNKKLKHTDVSLRWIQTNSTDGHFSIPENYWNYFLKCEEKRFIIFPFGFDCSNYMGHANYMIYDKKTRSLERFEPYGVSKRTCTNPKYLDKKIEKLFNTNLGKNFIVNYYKPLDFLPEKSFQKLQEEEKKMSKKNDAPGGYCSAWSCWYAEMRLSNPDKNRRYIVIKALKFLENNNDSLTEYIRNYSSYIVSKCR
jgi:hypothetical protein